MGGWHPAGWPDVAATLLAAIVGCVCCLFVCCVCVCLSLSRSPLTSPRNSLVASTDSAVLLAVIVEKSKKCLDFAVTLFIIHLLLCWGYNGIPAVSDWWIVHIAGTIVMVLLGEYLCSLKEMQDIPLLQL